MTQEVNPVDGQLAIPGTEGGNLIESIVNLAIKAKELKDEIEELEETKLPELKKKYKELTEKYMPSLMEAVELTELKLRNGSKIILADRVFASVPKARMDDVEKWLVEHKMDGIIKREYSLQNEEDVSMVREIGIKVKEDRSIHHSRLTAFVKERLDAPDAGTFPKDLFGVTVSPVVTFK